MNGWQFTAAVIAAAATITTPVVTWLLGRRQAVAVVEKMRAETLATTAGVETELAEAESTRIRSRVELTNAIHKDLEYYHAEVEASRSEVSELRKEVAEMKELLVRALAERDDHAEQNRILKRRELRLIKLLREHGIDPTDAID